MTEDEYTLALNLRIPEAVRRGLYVLATNSAIYEATAPHGALTQQEKNLARAAEEWLRENIDNPADESG